MRRLVNIFLINIVPQVVIDRQYFASQTCGTLSGENRSEGLRAFGTVGMPNLRDGN
jgi:hypothetical protein